MVEFIYSSQHYNIFPLPMTTLTNAQVTYLKISIQQAVGIPISKNSSFAEIMSPSVQTAKLV